MAESAAQVRYRAEYIAGFEQRQSFVRKTVTTAADIQASSCVFLVADSGGDEAVTRGLNGLIPAKADNLTQYTATLVEWHDLRRRTRFNIYTSQGDGRKIMQENSMAVMNRKIDDEIITELNTATQDTGTAVKGSLELIAYAQTILGNNDVPLDNNVSALITPAFYAYLMQVEEFASADFVNSKPFAGSAPTMFRWFGTNFIVHPNLPGKGTSAEKCFLYHKNAVGHGCDIENLDVKIGYDEEQDYSWARTSGFMGSQILQNSGIVVINHDGSAYTAQ
jgi:hypothetical protein